MLVLVSRASLTQYLEEGSLVLVPVGEGHMDTPMQVGVVAWDVGAAGAGFRPIGSRAMN